MPKKNGSRRDSKGRVLNKGEGQRSDTKKYYYSYTSTDGKRHMIYADSLVELRKREPVIIPHFSCHVIRHTFCTRLCESGMNIKALQEIMGHAEI